MKPLPPQNALERTDADRVICDDRAHRYDVGPLTGPLMARKAHWIEIRLPIET